MGPPAPPPPPPMPPKAPARYLPLRWESTGDQWWYASPIDCAAANGHYDLVRELLRIDGNHLIKLTSLRRIRRLESVWDDDEEFRGAAKRRAAVARKLYRHCELGRRTNNNSNSSNNYNSLVAAGYGGWLIYTAAAGGDLGFVQELLERNPLLVFGEGEYGVTDVMYAAARGKNADVFRTVVEFAAVPKTDGGEGWEIPGEYRWEVMNRAVHAACRGGNPAVLRELLMNSDDDVLRYKDTFGSTLLHSAAARGQLEIVKYLIDSFKNITTSRDHHGNTALHVAAFRGQLSTAEALISASPSLIHLTNNSGDTFLHKAVLGFQTLQFRRLDRHLDFLNHFVLRRRRLLAEIINAVNNDRRTALHVAVAGNSHSDHIVRILASAEGIDLNASDSLGLTPLDLLRQGPRSASGDVLIRRLLSAGAIFSSDNHKARQAIASRIRMQAHDRGGSSSPGSCFGIPDAEIFLHAGVKTTTTTNTATAAIVDFAGSGSILSPASPEDMSPYNNNIEEEESGSNSYECYRRSSFNTAAAQIFKQVLNWPKLRDRKSKLKSMDFEAPTIDYPIQTTVEKSSEWDPPPLAPLRKRFSKHTTTTTTSNNNKRSLAARSNQSSPSLKKKKKLREGIWRSSRSSSFSKKSSLSSPPSSSSEKLKGIFSAVDRGGADVPGPSSSSNNGGSNSKRMKSQSYLCFGNSGVSVKSPVYRQSFKRPVSLVA